MLSFTKWDGIGGFDSIQWIGLGNYKTMFTVSPTFWPALEHNFIWLAFFVLLPTPFGIFLAYLLDKNIRGTQVLPERDLPAGGHLGARSPGSSGRPSTTRTTAWSTA